MITIGCPSCRRRLRLPRALEGQAVRCPGCDQTFTASPALEVVPERPAATPPPRPPVRLDARPDAGPADADRRGRVTEAGDVLCPGCGEFIDREARRCRYCGLALGGDPERAPFWVRRDCEPHRGPWVQLLGVGSLLAGSLALVLCGLSGIVGLPLGVAAWLQAERDLAKMEAGLMDPSGMGPTRTGRVCGILGAAFSVACGLGYGLLFLLRL